MEQTHCRVCVIDNFLHTGDRVSVGVMSELMFLLVPNHFFRAPRLETDAKMYLPHAYLRVLNYTVVTGFHIHNCINPIRRHLQ